MLFTHAMLAFVSSFILIALVVAAREFVNVSLIGKSTTLTSLRFENEIKLTDSSIVNLDNFPSVIYSLAQLVKSGSFSFSRGVWDDKLWNEPTFSTKASGFEIELNGVNDRKVFAQAINLISGYFCASISTIKYEHVLRKNNQIWATLPQEALCVENLAPFQNLLSCRDVSGLSSMLHSDALHKSEYYSIQVQFNVDSENQLLFAAQMYLVNDLTRWNRGEKYSLQSVLGRVPNGSCLKSEIKIFGEAVELESIEKRTFTLPSFIDAKRSVQVHQFKSGVGDDEGGFGYAFRNLNDHPVTLKLTQRIPWMFRPFWHEATGTEIINSFSLMPAKFDRKSSSYIELEIALPARSTSKLLVPFEREFLRIDEFPANSERGIDFPGAAIKIDNNSSFETVKVDNNSSFTTNSILFTWPIPDATMPFNAITMSATVMALFYGAFFNMIFRRFYLRRPEDPPASPVGRLIWKFKTWIKSKKVVKEQ